MKVSSEDYCFYRDKHALVDADIIVWRSAAIAEPQRYCVTHEREGYYETFDTFKEAKERVKYEDLDVIWKKTEDKGVEFALMVTKNTILAIRDKLSPSGMSVYLSGKNNFRKEVGVTKPYKGSREFMAKPKYFREVREYLIKEWGAEVIDGIEPDDKIGIESQRLGEGSIRCTIDKDMDQLPGWTYDWVGDSVRRVTRREADFNLYAQVLSGDPVDDVPGLPGIGKKTAQKLLSGATSSKDLFSRAWGVYRDRLEYPSIEDTWGYFREQARLVYILRHEGDGFEQLPGYRNLEELGGSKT